MNKIATNFSIVLGLAAIAFAGYYMYTSQGSLSLSFNENEQHMQNMLNRTRVFIERSDTLNKVLLDISLFEDPLLLSLQDFSTPIETHPIGRPNPFAEVGN